MKIKDYKFTFNLSAVILFVFIMLPNIIWFAAPPSNDPLRNPSLIPTIDTLASIMQVVMIFSLCAIKNLTAPKFKFSSLIGATVIFCFLYYVCWILYYLGIVNGFIMICLCLLPCASFTFYAVDRKNYLSINPIIIFTVLHFVSTLINFV